MALSQPDGLYHNRTVYNITGPCQDGSKHPAACIKQIEELYKESIALQKRTPAYTSQIWISEHSGCGIDRPVVVRVCAQNESLAYQKMIHCKQLICPKTNAWGIVLFLD